MRGILRAPQQEVHGDPKNCHQDQDEALYQEEGMFNDLPTCIRRASNRGFAAIRASTFIPYLRAITVGVSPDLTVCVRPLLVGCVTFMPITDEPPDGNKICDDGWAADFTADCARKS